MQNIVLALAFFFLKKTNIKKFELKFYFLIVVCLFVGYTQVVSWIFWSLSLMVLAGFLVRTYFFILNNKTIFDSGCEQICLKKEIVCIPVQVYCCSIRTNKISVPIANCTLFGVCDLWEWDFKGVFFQTEWDMKIYSQTITHRGIPQASLAPVHLVNGVWVLAEVAALSIHFCSRLDHSFKKV